MSRVGKNPIPIPDGVKVSFAGNVVSCEGPKGKLTKKLHDGIIVEVADKEVKVSVKVDDRFHRALHGLGRALTANMILGVTQGYSKQLQIVGVGFRAQLQGKILNLQLGYSHPIVYKIPDGITIEVPSATEIAINGIDKQLVGQTAADIRHFYPPEPYKGKGVMYKGEQIRRKAGKAVA